MENVTKINAESRSDVGKKIAKKLRKEGKIPAIIYGGNKESIPISIMLNDVKAILKMEKGENTILRIHRDKVMVDAMLKEIQYDYLSDQIVHADFIRIDLDKEIEVNIPISVTGEPIGVKLEDGLFDFVTREIRIRCLPADIPAEIELDVSELHAGDSIRVESIPVTEKIKFLSDPQTVICAVTSKTKMEEEEVAEEVEEEGEEAAETEETEEKTEE